MRLVPVTICLLALGACGDSSTFRADGGYVSDAGPYTTGDDDDATAPEDELPFLSLPPAQTPRYVFVANPNRDTVTRIDVRSLDVRTTSVGREPDLVQTTPDGLTAVVFNRGEDSVSLVDAATLSTQTVPIRPNFNQLTLSPSGAWAALYHDTRRVDADDPEPDGLLSFNEASFVHVPSGEHFAMAVGFNPRMIRFTEDERLAVIVSDATVATVDLTQTPLSPRLIPLAPEDLDPPAAEQVVISPSGAFAILRQFGADHLLVVDLDSGQVDQVPVGANPTDMDRTPDGLETVVVARDDRALWVFSSDDPFAAADVLPFPIDLPFGSLTFAATGERAMLFTTAGLVDRYVIWDRTTETMRTRALVKPVAGVTIDPTGRTALVFHTLADAPGAPETPFSGSHALTLLRLDDDRTNPMRLPAASNGFATSDDGERGYFTMEGVPLFGVLDFDTMLADEIPLRSNPQYVGVLPRLTDDEHPPAWVSQDHELGRISFFEPDSATLETITGFELNSAIE